MKTKLAPLFLLLVVNCSFISHKVFPDTQNLNDLKTTYNHYVSDRDNSTEPSKILEERANSQKLVDKLLKEAPKDSSSYMQAVLVNALLQSESGVPSKESIDVLEKYSSTEAFAKQESWFRGMAFAMQGMYYAQIPGLEPKAGVLFDRVLSQDYPVDVKAFVLVEWTNYIFDKYQDNEEVLIEKLQTLLDKIENQYNLRTFNDEELFLAIAQIYSNVGDDTHSCELAKKILLSTDVSRVIQNEASHLVETDCGEEL